MNFFLRCLITLLSVCFSFFLYGQDSVAYKWKVASKKTGINEYDLIFSTAGNKNWQLYAPAQVLNEVVAAELKFSDSALQRTGGFIDSGAVKNIPSSIFEQTIKVYEGITIWRHRIKIAGTVPETLIGSLLYSYGRGDEFYQEEHAFSVELEGGIASMARILISSIDVKNPVAPCGDADPTNSSLWTLFLLGIGAGLLALLFPCIFPLIPLTVSFFTKRSVSRKKGIMNALFYGFSIFLIYTLLSAPFHIFNVQPEVLNNISTNVVLNLTFFIVFIVLAISFFGYFEITLPSSFANKADSKSGLGNLAGIFFMALTLAIISFSCTSGILGVLLVGSLNSDGGAWQLTAGMAGFGLGLGLPFVLFALFPNWLQSLPKSGGWMNELKVVFGFLELAMAVKFLSNADLVKQWGLLKREVFIGIWIIIGVAIVLYLLGIIRFAHDSKPKMTKVRLVFILLFAAATLYLVPGLTNTKAATLNLISGFPPPLSYSLFKRQITIEPIHNDYEKALELSREQNKPVLIDFTGWACVNCRRMEENVWIDPEVEKLMKNDFIVVSLYVDERIKLPAAQQIEYTTKTGDKKPIITVGDKWATFQSENFNAVSQPQYAILSPGEKALTKTKGYTPDGTEFKEWLECGLKAHRNSIP